MSNQTQCKLIHPGTLSDSHTYIYACSHKSMRHTFLLFVDVRVLLVKTDDFRWISIEMINWWRSMPANTYLPCQLVMEYMIRSSPLFEDKRYKRFLFFEEKKMGANCQGTVDLYCTYPGQ